MTSWHAVDRRVPSRLGNQWLHKLSCDRGPAIRFCVVWSNDSPSVGTSAKGPAFFRRKGSPPGVKTDMDTRNAPGPSWRREVIMLDDGSIGTNVTRPDSDNLHSVRLLPVYQDWLFLVLDGQSQRYQHPDI